MKKLAIIVAMAFVSFAATAQTLSMQLGYVDFNELIQLMPEADAAREQTENASREAQEAYQDMMQEFQTKYQQFQQKQESWSQAVKETKMAELQQIEYRIQEFQQSIQQELQQTQQMLQAPIIEKAQKVIGELAAEKGLAAVFEKGNLVYVDPVLCYDLTPEARVKLNIPEGRTLATLQAELQAKAQAQMQQ
ncbi:MAG: OmpH family outer membrane protein [Bacteroidales bacterium]|nr:OmpH family outer membrane protein [Bacteroidales bacterium]